MHILSFVIFILFALLAAFLVFNYPKEKKTTPIEDSDKIKVLNDHNFDHQIKRGIILVDFWAPWCMPCKTMAPVLNSLSEELDGNAAVAKLNVDIQQSITLRYGVKKIPTMVLFKNGEEINRYTGFRTKDFLLKEIAKVKQV
ncbi:MAG: thioredoxin [Bacteroidota bacterium]|nr:thioredoxin [Bacteroidota bacterium]